MIPQDLPVRHRTGSYRERRSLSLLGTPPVRGSRPTQSLSPQPARARLSSGLMVARRVLPHAISAL